MTDLKNDAITTVIDAGARYGMHPSWRGFAGDLRYFAFEPDLEEAKRLQAQSEHPGIEVIECALAKDTGERDLYVTRHRGYTSLLQVDATSEWFDNYRPGEGEVELVARVQTLSVDDFAATRGLHVDFLKVDTEGTELEVLEGASQQLRSGILGLRINVNFQTCYKNQALFPEIHAFLAGQGFFLLNLDYFGRGVPRNSLFRNPDPLSADNERYGTLIGTDGVWLKDFDYLCEALKGSGESFAYACLKYAYFCMLNHGPDVGIDTLHRFLTKHSGHLTDDVCATALYRGLRRRCAEFLGRYRVFPDGQWEYARTLFKSIFDIDLEGGWKYWNLLRTL
jgi:FkbM family methyltransferase